LTVLAVLESTVPALEPEVLVLEPGVLSVTELTGLAGV
jgi:hypothetical protein